MQRYDPKQIEPKWQQYWQKEKINQTDTSSPKAKYYIIPMFPYPSGDLHIGHWYNYAPTDTIARWHRMRGYNVLHATGFDSFGLPAENAAIKRNIPPAEWTNQNMTSMSDQLASIGASYDLRRKVVTSDPSYYKWTQWLFLKLYEKGQAYRKKALVNWCPKDQTVLANEQTIGEDGTKNVCVRCGTPIEQKELNQWYFKITDYADRLLDGLNKMDLPERVKTMQENWIGRSRGAEIDFEVDGQNAQIKVFTTRADTLYGVTYMVLAPEHDLVEQITTDEQKQAVAKYVEEALGKTELDRKEGEKDKTGVFTGAYAINPINKEKIPIWIADYVLTSYGTGAIMAVPAHDGRDHEFAVKYGLPIRVVVEPVHGQPEGDEVEKTAAFVVLRNPKTDKAVVLDWGSRKERYGGKMLIGEALEDIDKDNYKKAAERGIREETGYKNIKFIAEADFSGHGYFYSNTKNKNIKVSGRGLLYDLVDEDMGKTDLDEGEKGKFKVTWEPISQIAGMLDDGIHEAFFRYLVLGEPYTGEGRLANSELYNGMDSAHARETITKDLAQKGAAEEKTNFRMHDWLISRQRYWGAPIPIVHCEKCGTVAIKEVDLPVRLPEDVEFMPTGQSPLLSRDDFVNTDCPSCGGPAIRETDTMDTFVDSSWYFLRYPDPDYEKGAFNPEVVNAWGPLDHYIGGIEHAILHLLYARYITKFLHEHEGLAFDEPFKRLSNQGIILGPDGEKMSKSRGNVVSPDEQLNSYGADSLRLYLMFMGPYDQGGAYSFGGIAGSRRFIDRLWNLTREFLEFKGERSDEPDSVLLKISSQATKKVSQDLHELQFNTAIAAMMEAVNHLYKHRTAKGFKRYNEWQNTLGVMIRLLAPFAPHVADELWHQIGNDSTVHLSEWPKWDETHLREEQLQVVIQINGKVRASISANRGAAQDDVLKIALRDDKVANFVGENEPKRVIYVPDRLLNIVL